MTQWTIIWLLKHLSWKCFISSHFSLTRASHINFTGPMESQPKLMYRVIEDKNYREKRIFFPKEFKLSNPYMWDGSVTHDWLGSQVDSLLFFSNQSIVITCMTEMESQFQTVERVKWAWSNILILKTQSWKSYLFKSYQFTYYWNNFVTKFSWETIGVLIETVLIL